LFGKDITSTSSTNTLKAVEEIELSTSSSSDSSFSHPENLQESQIKVSEEDEELDFFPITKTLNFNSDACVQSALFYFLTDDVFAIPSICWRQLT
jgi:hypothetical protein